MCVIQLSLLMDVEEYKKFYSKLQAQPNSTAVLWLKLVLTTVKIR